MSFLWRFKLSCAMACLLLAGCTTPAPEQALRAAMGELQEAIQARESAVFEDRLARDFIGPQGLDREGARRMAQALYLRHRDIGIIIGPMEITVQGQHATVRFDAVLAGGSGGLLPASARIYAVTTGWGMEDGEWRMSSAQWVPRSQKQRM